MFNTLRHIAKQSTEVLESQAALAEKRLRRFGVLVALLVCAGCIGGAAACGVLAGIVILLVPALGVAGAILITAGITLLICLAGLGTWMARSNAAVRSAEFAAASSRVEWNNAVGIDSTSDTHGGGSERDTPRAGPGGTAGEPSELVNKAINAATSHPGLLAGAAFAFVSIFGVRRSISTLRTAAAVASAGVAASRFASSANGLFDQSDNTRTQEPCADPDPGVDVAERSKMRGARRNVGTLPPEFPPQHTHNGRPTQPL
ncbi:MAG: phage holin family protein [Phycisphaerales bacterium]|nr:phage holin family protein [Phycisphaerales bacterium]